MLRNDWKCEHACFLSKLSMTRIFRNPLIVIHQRTLLIIIKNWTNNSRKYTWNYCLQCDVQFGQASMCQAFNVTLTIAFFHCVLLVSSCGYSLHSLEDAMACMACPGSSDTGFYCPYGVCWIHCSTRWAGTRQAQTELFVTNVIQVGALG